MTVTCHLRKLFAVVFANNSLKFTICLRQVRKPHPIGKLHLNADENEQHHQTEKKNHQRMIPTTFASVRPTTQSESLSMNVLPEFKVFFTTLFGVQLSLMVFTGGNGFR